MKKIFTLLVAFAATLCSFAAMPGTMNFVGNSTYSVASKSYTMTKDTVKVSNGNTAITMPQITVPLINTKLPEITFSDLTYTMEGNPMTGSAVFTWDKDNYDFDIDINGTTKTITVSNVHAVYTHATGELTFDVTLKFKYSFFNITLSYSHTGYYTIDNAWGLIGRGTEKNPYKIYDTDDFAAIAKNCTAQNTGEGEYFQMMNDIDFGGSADSPVQLPAIAKSAISNVTTVSYGFNGTFDGDNHTITGIYHTNCANNTDGKFNAIFSSLGTEGTVKNLVIGADNYIKSYNYVAPIVCLSQGTIENCTNNAPIIAANAFASGICGYMIKNNGTISGCTNNGDITAMTYATGICAGSQSGPTTIGAHDADYAYVITDCTNNGNMSTVNGVGSAGIAGTYSGSITNCTNNGTIDDTKGTSKSRQYTAGIVSCMTYINNVTGNVNNGEVKGINYVGGVIGCIMKGGDEAYSIAGNTNSGTVTAEGTPSGDILGGSKRTFDIVIADIDAIGDVVYTEECIAAVETARAAYDALSEEKQELVTNYDELLDAEDQLAMLAELKETIDETQEAVNDATDSVIAKALQKLVDAAEELLVTPGATEFQVEAAEIALNAAAKVADHTDIIGAAVCAAVKAALYVQLQIADRVLPYATDPIFNKVINDGYYTYNTFSTDAVEAMTAIENILAGIAINLPSLRNKLEETIDKVAGSIAGNDETLSNAKAVLDNPNATAEDYCDAIDALNTKAISTGINAAAAQQQRDGKFIENNRIVIKKAGRTYNVIGQ